MTASVINIDLSPLSSAPTRRNKRDERIHQVQEPSQFDATVAGSDGTPLAKQQEQPRSHPLLGATNEPTNIAGRQKLPPDALFSAHFNQKGADCRVHARQ
jgi:hypothetical protein